MRKLEQPAVNLCITIGVVMRNSKHRVVNLLMLTCGADREATVSSLEERGDRWRPVSNAFKE